MYSEVLIEEGIVVSSEKGFAKISLLKNENCRDCSAKIICKPGNGESHIIEVSDPYGTAPGDIVKISIKGTVILKSTFILYGLPLLLLLITIFSVNLFLTGLHLIELYSFLTGIFVLSLYYLIFFFLKSYNKKLIVPEIISLTRQPS